MCKLINVYSVISVIEDIFLICCRKINSWDNFSGLGEKKEDKECNFNFLSS